MKPLHGSAVSVCGVLRESLVFSSYSRKGDAFQISNVDHLEKVFFKGTTEIEPPSRGRNAGHRRQCDDLWKIFMLATLKAAVQLGQDYAYNEEY